jgi:transposase-like protein
VHALGYLGTGRRYGVTDNAIRKWIRQYEREQAARSEPDDRVTSAPDGYAAA